MGAGGPHEAQVVAAIRARRTSRGADRSHRGRRPARGSAHDPRKRGGRPRLRSHAGLAPSQSGRAGAGDTGSRFKTSTAFRVRASPWRYTRAVGTDRPDPEALLARVKAEEARQRRGKLKIFLGAAAGVGKTYSMLEAVREQKADGVDTVVGYVETHGRAETDALLAGLETLHPMTVDYRGTTLREFELDAALARHPTLILVDAQMRVYMHEHAIGKAWPTAERLLVCISPGPESARLVRAGRRMADRLGAPWVAAYVETPAQLRLPPQVRDRVTQTLRLAEQL